MAHGKLGGGRGEDTVRTATFRGTNSAGATEIVGSMEATEDRHIRGVMVQSAVDPGEEGYTQVEASFSSEANLFGPGTDATSSGTVAYHYSVADSTNGWAYSGEEYVEIGVDDVAGGIDWDEGEELNIHANNNLASGQAVRVLVYYERKSDC